MLIISALKDLGFSFWQVVVIFVVLLFRIEIRQILDRVKSFKLAGNEIALRESDIGLVEDIRKIEDDASKKDTTVQELRHELSTVLRRRCIGALLHIRSLTTALWPNLKDLKDNQAVLIVDIRTDTYKEIEPSLRLLSAAGMFEYSTIPANSSLGVQKLSLLNIHPLLREVVSEVDGF
jgi:hypothetical protein